MRAYFWLLSALMALPVPAFAQREGIFLLEPIGGTGEIPVDGGGLGPFLFYVSKIYPWMLGMGAGIALLMATWGGVQIIQSGADTGARDAGKNRLLMSLGGLLLLLLSATVMNILNPTFFK